MNPLLSAVAKKTFVLAVAWLIGLGVPANAAARYYAHEAVEDRFGVIAPWHEGLNGQCDFRVRIAAETLKRYPWAQSPKTGDPAPDYVYNGRWKIAPDGTITPQPLEPWANGDLAQRAAFTILGFVDYYRYTGDPAAIAHISIFADMLLRHCQTDADHPWPNFLISVPNRGEPYGQANPHGMIQLDIVSQVGLALCRAYQLTGNTHWFDTAKHWADLLAEKREHCPGFSPWNRYANPEDVFWSDRQTGGVTLILEFFDELIDLGYRGPNDSIVKAREAGRAYLRDVLLPNWTAEDTWGRHYWDWDHHVQGEVCTEVAARYMMENPDTFPNWRIDARNIMSLFIHHASVSPKSNGDVYSGAWAYPEGPACCGRSLWYAPMQVGSAFAEYAALADSEWARELARRKFILATYDCHETGVVEDNIDGGQIVAGGWFKIAHPFPLKFVLDAMAWLPDVFGANRENHICRTSGVVNHVVYGKGKIAYSTFDAPANTVDVLRLAFMPTQISADGEPLDRLEELTSNGYTIKSLSNGDCIVTIRHDGRRSIAVEGHDPQEVIDETGLTFEGTWDQDEYESHRGGTARVASAEGASVSLSFDGNQVRLIGAVSPTGGKADVYLDGVKQLSGIDCWNPYSLQQQVLWYKNGLKSGKHTLKVVVLGEKNPLAKGADVCVDAVQFSAAVGKAGFGQGGGPNGPQRWIFGYPERKDYIDSGGHTWRPATEVVIRSGNRADAVAEAWHTTPRRWSVIGTDDPALYGYGMHGKDLTAYFTVGPGSYHVRLKLMETRFRFAPNKRAMDVYINGKQVISRMDVAATACGQPATVSWVTISGVKIREGLNQAVDLVFDDIEPEHGTIAVRLTGCNDGEAVISAIEVGPGPGGDGATPISAVDLPQDK